jgi:hypothetical protein
MYPSIRACVTVLIVTIVAARAHFPPNAAAADRDRYTLSLELNGTPIEGTPLFSSAREVQLLGRDGRLFVYAPEAARNSRQTAPKFHSYTAVEMRAQLTRELGQSFDISGTGHYLVAHPKGQRDVWAARFEDLYRSLVHYFSRRNVLVHDPEFPLVAIVWRNQQEFLRYAAQDGATVSNQVLGYYSPRSNRIALFDTSGGNGTGGAAWQQNADTIIHEATHQTAYNTGLHQRFAATPRWLVEGLATMFEARGVWNSRDYQKQSDRYNLGRLEQFRKIESARLKGALAELIAGDRVFERDVNRAYAQAWALTFYLVETQSHRYSEYLKLTARRPAFSDYPTAERMKDFASVFGDLSLLEAHFLRYMDALK